MQTMLLLLNSNLGLIQIWKYMSFLVQIVILALMCIALDLESVGPTVRMTLGVSVMTNALHMKTQCALRTEQLTTTDAGIS